MPGLTLTSAISLSLARWVGAIVASESAKLNVDCARGG